MGLTPLLAPVLQVPKLQWEQGWGWGHPTVPHSLVPMNGVAAPPCHQSPALSTLEPGNKPPLTPPQPLCFGGGGPHIPELQTAATSSGAEPQELSDG